MKSLERLDLEFGGSGDDRHRASGGHTTTLVLTPAALFGKLGVAMVAAHTGIEPVHQP